MINEELCRVEQWLTARKLLLNLSKSKYVIFNYRRNCTLPAIYIGHGEILRTDPTKFLGIHLDENLTFTTHFDAVAINVSKLVGILYRLKYFLPEDVLYYLYNSFIKPYFLYGIKVWYPSANYNKEKLFRIQKYAIRFICNLPRNSHTSFHFNQWSILMLEDPFYYLICLRLFKAVHYGIDGDLFNELPMHSDIHFYSTRFRFNLLTPLFHRAKSQSSISFIGPDFWNKLHKNIKEIETFPNFKKCLFDYFLSKY